jgi:hypothetical protein
MHVGGSEAVSSIAAPQPMYSTDAERVTFKISSHRCWAVPYTRRRQALFTTRILREACPKACPQITNTYRSDSEEVYIELGFPDQEAQTRELTGPRRSFGEQMKDAIRAHVETGFEAAASEQWLARRRRSNWRTVSEKAHAPSGRGLVLPEL